MTQRATGQRFRQRKLSTKQNLAILREHDVEKLPDDEAQRLIPKVETGVEKGEEIVSPFFPCAKPLSDLFRPLPMLRGNYTTKPQTRFNAIIGWSKLHHSPFHSWLLNA